MLVNASIATQLEVGIGQKMTGMPDIVDKAWELTANNIIMITAIWNNGLYGTRGRG